MSIAVVPTGETLAQEFEELFRENCQFVYRTAYGITGNRQDAEDVLQTIFLKLLQGKFSSDFRKNPPAYLHRAAVNLSLNVLRSKRRKVNDSSPAGLYDGRNNGLETTPQYEGLIVGQTQGGRMPVPAFG